MANQTDNKFTWFISNLSPLKNGVYLSDVFIISGCKWRLFAYRKGLGEPDCFNLSLIVNDHESLPPGWRRLAQFNITIVNQDPEKSFKLIELRTWFDKSIPVWVCPRPLSLSKLHAEDGEFKIVVEIDVVEVTGKLDVVEVATPPLKKTKLNDDGDFVQETIDVNGFQVLPSQVESVRCLFEKHPDIASSFRAKNQHLRTACMNVLLSLTEILRQLPREISKDDLANACVLLGSLNDAGFVVDWLEKKVKEVSEKKEKEKACKTRMLEIQKEWKNLKAEVSDAGAPLTLDDLV